MIFDAQFRAGLARPSSPPGCAVVLDAMGVLYQAWDDLAELLIRPKNVAAAAALGFDTILVDFAGVRSEAGSLRTVGELRAALVARMRAAG